MKYADGKHYLDTHVHGVSLGMKVIKWRYMHSKVRKFDHQVDTHVLGTSLGMDVIQIWSLDGATCISCKYVCQIDVCISG